MVAQSTPTVLPAAQAEVEVDRHIPPVCLILLGICFHFVLEESLHVPCLFLGAESFNAYLEEVVQNIYNRYVQSQQDLPLEEQRMPEEGQVQDSPSLELRLISFGSDFTAAELAVAVRSSSAISACLKNMSGRSPSA